MSKSEGKKIKDTNLGKWLKEKAPSVLDTVGDLLPDQGALGVVKNLLDKEPGISPEEAKAAVEAEVGEAHLRATTRRHESAASCAVRILR